MASTACAGARSADGDPSIQVLLDAWGAALRTDDVAALRDLVDQSAAPGILQRQLARARNLATVPFADFGFELAADRASSDASREVFLRYAIDGPDPAPTRTAMSIVVAQREGEWKLVTESGTCGPWDFGPIATTRVGIDGTDSVILAHPGQDDFAAALALDLPDAVRDVSQAWGGDWRRAVVVVTTGSAAEFTALGGVSDSAVAAVSVSDEAVAETPPTGQRIVFSPEAATRLTESTRNSVLRHELTHVAARARTVTGSPMWVLEGFADYVGYRDARLPFDRVAPNLVRAHQPVEVPDDAEFAGDAATIAYEKAWSIWAFVADSFGGGTIVPLYRALARGPVDAEGVDSVLAHTLGVSRADFVTRWNGWIDDRRGGAG